MSILIGMIEFLASFIEGYIGIKFAGLFLDRKYDKIKTEVIGVVVSALLAVFVGIANKVFLFSYLTLFVGCCCVSMVVHLLFSGRAVSAFLITSFYFVIFNYLDFFSISITGLILDIPNYSKIVISSFGVMRLRQMIICKGLLILMYLLAKRFINVKFREDSIKHFTVLTIAGIIGVVYLIQSTITELSLEDAVGWGVFSVLAILGWTLFTLFLENRREAEAVRFMEMRNALLEENYKSLQDAYSANAKMYHDFNNHVNVLYQFLVRGDSQMALRYLEGISEPVKHFLEKTWTGNDVIDIIMNSKLEKMRQKGIEYKINVEFPRNSDILSSDICAILSNLLDNAIEATQNNVIADSKWISITIRMINAMLIFKIENGIEIMPIAKGGEFHTSKNDSNLHGWGLRSVKTAVEKYEGILQYHVDKNRFQVVVTLNYNSVKV